MRCVSSPRVSQQQPATVFATHAKLASLLLLSGTREAELCTLFQKLDAAAC